MNSSKLLFDSVDMESFFHFELGKGTYINDRIFMILFFIKPFVKIISVSNVAAENVSTCRYLSFKIKE